MEASSPLLRPAQAVGARRRALPVLAALSVAALAGASARRAARAAAPPRAPAAAPASSAAVRLAASSTDPQPNAATGGLSNSHPGAPQISLSAKTTGWNTTEGSRMALRATVTVSSPVAGPDDEGDVYVALAYRPESGSKLADLWTPFQLLNRSNDWSVSASRATRARARPARPALSRRVARARARSRARLSPSPSSRARARALSLSSPRRARSVDVELFRLRPLTTYRVHAYKVR